MTTFTSPPPSRKRRITRTAMLLGAIVVVLAWILYFHNEAIVSHLPNWNWLRGSVARLGQQTEVAAPVDEDPDNAKNEIPVHVAHISQATLHRYVEGFGTIAPRPQRSDGTGASGELQSAGSANIASSVVGVVAKVLVQGGQQVHANDPLIQLDDRLAKSAVDQAQATLHQAEASLAAMKALPRPDQLQIANLAIQKAKKSVDFVQKNYDRVKQLVADQITPGKNLEQATQDVAAAQNDLAVAEQQLAVLKATPTAEDIRQENAKVAQAAALLASAKIQQQMLTIVAPIDATVVSVTVNPGEPVDTTRPLVQLVAMDRLLVDVDVPADQLPADAQGLHAQIFPSGSSGSDQPDFMGVVSFVSPQVDPKNGAVQVSIDLPAGNKLRPGLTVRVRIIAEEHKDTLAAPREAVVADENGDSVIALVEGDRATHKHVKMGLQENGLVEIVADGVKSGDTVVTAGAYGLPQATRVKVIE